MKRLLGPIIPNAVTALCLLFGYLSLVNSLHGHYMTAAWFILFANYLDVLDGGLAKALDVTSKAGAVFDSLSDLTTFGIAPAILLYSVYLSHWGTAGVLLGFLPILAGATRLARFTAGAGGDKDYFRGLPIPIAATLPVGYVVFSPGVWGGYGSPAVATALLVAAAALMVSRVRYDTDMVGAPRVILRHWKGWVTIACVVSCPLFPTKGFFLWAIFYISLGIVRWLWTLATRMGRQASGQQERLRIV